MVTEHTHTSWFSRLTSSLGGVVFGLLLIGLAVGGLWWNEGRAVKRAKGLDEGASSVRSVEAGKINSEMNGALIHVSGEVAPGAEIVDPLTEFVYDGLSLDREVEMFQWRENKETKTKKNLGGSEDRVTTYSYARSWESRAVSSNNFKEAAAHQNPPLPFKSEDFFSDGATLGAYSVGSRVLRSLPRKELYDVEGVTMEIMAGRDVHLQSGIIYLGDDPSAPEIGDIRIQYFGAEPQAASIIAKQNGSSLESYPTKSGSSIFLVEPGYQSPENMFVTAQKANTIMTWLIRGGGLLALFVGFSTVMKPVSVFADVVPFFGSIAAAGISVISFLLSCILGFVTVALAWIFFRPMVGGILLAIVIAAAAILVLKIKSNKTVTAD